MRSKLEETRGSELIEGNTWGDRFWGVSRGIGENHLGKILMEERGEEFTGPDAVSAAAFWDHPEAKAHWSRQAYSRSPRPSPLISASVFSLLLFQVSGFKFQVSRFRFQVFNL